MKALPPIEKLRTQHVDVLNASPSIRLDKKVARIPTPRLKPMPVPKVSRRLRWVGGGRSEFI